jgi:hypothetical protein
MKALVFALLTLFALATPASAQTISQWTARIYLAGATGPISTTTLLPANVVCGLPLQPVGTTVNPNKIQFDDPVTPLAYCVWTDPGTGLLASTPFGGTYEGTLTATNSVATSAESARAGFTHPGLPPGVPTSLRLVR